MAIIIGLAVAAAIVLAAARIILGWLLPRRAMAAVDQAFNAAAALCVKLVVIALAGGILYLIFASAG